MLISLGGCENKSDNTETVLPAENTTEVIGTPQTEKQTQTLKLSSAAKSDIPNMFNLVNLRGDRLGMSIKGDKVVEQPQDKPIILINIFDINDSDSLSQLPYLQRLQDKYTDRLLVVSIPANMPLNKEQLNQLVQKMELKYFISFADHHQEIIQMLLNTVQCDTLTTPTTLLYDKEGINQGLYEGLTPIEMMAHDILRIKVNNKGQWIDVESIQKSIR